MGRPDPVPKPSVRTRRPRRRRPGRPRRRTQVRGPRRTHRRGSARADRPPPRRRAASCHTRPHRSGSRAVRPRDGSEPPQGRRPSRRSSFAAMAGCVARPRNAAVETRAGGRDDRPGTHALGAARSRRRCSPRSRSETSAGQRSDTSSPVACEQIDLTAVGGGAESSAAVRRDPVVVAVAKLRVAGVDRDTHTNVAALGPRLALQGKLQLHRGVHTVACVFEHRERGIALALALDERSTARGNSGANRPRRAARSRPPRCRGAPPIAASNPRRRS